MLECLGNAALWLLRLIVSGDTRNAVQLLLLINDRVLNRLSLGRISPDSHHSASRIGDANDTIVTNELTLNV